jgi:prepilin-type N-terminal cleavage/methylation domain-containing protein
MARPTSATDGFTLLEMLVVMACLSAMAMIAVPVTSWQYRDYTVWPYRYLEAQAEAIRKAETVEMKEEEGYEGERITFDEKGYIPRAGTVRFHDREIVMELGGGRLVFR